MTHGTAPPAAPAAGFSLVAVSVLLAVAGIVLAGMLPGGRGDTDDRILTVERMQAVENATRAYMTLNARRPCPADGTQPRTSAYFGVANATAGTCDAAPNPVIADVTSGTFAGTAPVKKLNLSDEYAYDGYGRLMTYVVDKRMTMTLATTVCNGVQLVNPKGAIRIKKTSTDSYPYDTTGWALVSYGKTGHGAFLASTGAQMNANATDADVLVNALVDNSFARSFTGTLIKKEPTASFDNIVWWQQSTKATCALGALASPSGCTSLWGCHGGKRGFHPRLPGVNRDRPRCLRLGK